MTRPARFGSRGTEGLHLAGKHLESDQEPLHLRGTPARVPRAEPISSSDAARMVTKMDKSVTISRVGASVRLDEQQDYGPDQLPVAAQLFAYTAAGVRLSVGRPTIVGGMPRRGSSAAWKRYTARDCPRKGRCSRTTA